MPKAPKEDPDKIVNVSLNQIRPAPWNPRRSMDEAAIEELVASIRQIGLRTPIQIRVKKSSDGGKYEIVSGHRRFEAVKRIAAKDGTTELIQARIENIPDDIAFLMNLGEQVQREQLTDVEEAAAFSDFAKKFPADAVDNLRLKTGKNESYIRRRLAIAGLSKPFQWAWKEKILTAAHLMQFLRVDKKTALQVLGATIKRAVTENDPMTVRELKRIFDRASVPLATAKFDRAGCTACRHNSQVQMSIFGDNDLAQCADPKCFIEKQRVWVVENWAALGLTGHNTFRFHQFDEFEWQHMSFTPDPACQNCPDRGAVLLADGSVYSHSEQCFGKSECHAEKYPPFNRSSGPTEKKEGEPRVAWHGEYFRQQLYREKLPEVIRQLDYEGGDKPMRVQLILLLRRHGEIHEWFQQEIKALNVEGKALYHHLNMAKIIEMVDAASEAECEVLLSLGAAQVFCAERIVDDMDRQLLATYLGIKPEHWAINEEYLKKKNKAEIVKLLADLGFMKDPTFLNHLRKKKNLSELGELANLKKSELVTLILESGAAVAGIVPAEVLALPDPPRQYCETGSSTGLMSAPGDDQPDPAVFGNTAFPDDTYPGDDGMVEDGECLQEAV